MRTFQFDLYEAILFKRRAKSVKRSAPYKLMKHVKRASERKLFVSNPGSISCKAVFIYVFTSKFVLLSTVFFFALSGKLFCSHLVIFCDHFFSQRATVASKIVNTQLVHFPYKVKL